MNKITITYYTREVNTTVSQHLDAVAEMTEILHTTDPALTLKFKPAAMDYSWGTFYLTTEVEKSEFLAPLRKAFDSIYAFEWDK